MRLPSRVGTDSDSRQLHAQQSVKVKPDVYPTCGLLAYVVLKTWSVKTRTIGIGETWWRAIAKSIIIVFSREVVAACKIHNVCVGLQGGIEAAIHTMNTMWGSQRMEKEGGFVLIDAKKSFNEMDWTVMLWNVRHEWPSGARFFFNAYKHWATLVIRTNDDKGETLHSKQGMTQGYPLASNVYAVGLLPLIRKLKKELTSVNQPCFADDAGAAGKIKLLRGYKNWHQNMGTIKSLLKVNPHSSATQPRRHQTFICWFKIQHLGCSQPAMDVAWRSHHATHSHAWKVL
jgi:hypothetical protein